MDIAWTKHRVFAHVEDPERPQSFLALLRPNLERIGRKLVVGDVEVLECGVLA